MEDKTKEQLLNELEELRKRIVAFEEEAIKHKELEEQLREMTIRDDLTGLLNRRGFFTLTEHRINIAKREKVGLLLLYADVDNLKEVNDKFGHEEGDRLLISTADILKSTYRESDIIARIGGDEFVVFPVGTTKDHVQIIKSRVEKKIDEFNAQKAQSYKLSVSIGISTYEPRIVTTIDELLASADRLMYQHKHSKKEQG